MVSQQSNTNGGSLKRSLAADFTNEDLGSVDERYVNGPTEISSQFNINDNLNAVVQLNSSRFPMKVQAFTSSTELNNMDTKVGTNQLNDSSILSRDAITNSSRELQQHLIVNKQTSSQPTSQLQKDSFNRS
jgi:hypothetical protein